ncbi:MAG: hypothetical protein ACQEUZ_17165 [Pseudomonadota bacterium]
MSVFGAWTLDNNWHQIFLDPPEVRFENAGLAGIGVAWPVWSPVEGATLEIEGQIVRHFGDQDHWELNAPLATLRWTRFPWSDLLRTSAAFGIGPSFASEVPTLERRNDGDSDAAKLYWKIELGVALPREGWEAFWRLHHRSSAYGVFGDAGGANAIGFGLRRDF